MIIAILYSVLHIIDVLVVCLFLIVTCVFAFGSDFGFIISGESDGIWNPRPSWLSHPHTECVQDSDVHNITDGRPANCPYGTNYHVTSGKSLSLVVIVCH